MTKGFSPGDIIECYETGLRKEVIAYNAYTNLLRLKGGSNGREFFWYSNADDWFLVS